MFILQLNKPYLFSNPIIQNGHDLSCCLQQRSDFEKPPISEYFFAVQPLPHHFVPGTIRRLDKSLRCLQLSLLYLVGVVTLHKNLYILCKKKKRKGFFFFGKKDLKHNENILRGFGCLESGFSVYKYFSFRFSDCPYFLLVSYLIFFIIITKK